jgi:hypothetical protein
MVVFSCDRAAPEATEVKLMFLPEALIDCLAPSIRGWMLAVPGVAMKPTASPPFGMPATIRLPSSCPDTNRSWPM